MPGPRSDHRAKWIEDLKKKGEVEVDKDGRMAIIEVDSDTVTVEEGLKQSRDTTVYLHPGHVPREMTKKFKNQSEMRRFLQSCISEQEVLTMKMTLMRIAIDSGHKDAVKACSLLWSYVMGSPNMETKVEVQAGAPGSELTEEEKRQKILSVVAKDPVFKSPEFKKLIIQALAEEKP